MTSANPSGKSAADGENVHLYVTAKRLAGIIRSLKEQIANEMKIWQETSADNRQLEADIQQFQKRLKALDVLCINCEAHNAEIELRKKRYSEQLTKISKLVSEQNFDAANWAIILDEMAFVNRELFEILMSTEVAERRALHVVTAEEEKYRMAMEKLILKRVELRKQLRCEMDSYESLRAQIKSTESSLSHLRKAIDVYDAEFWQLDDARHDLQSQSFQLQELLRHTRRHRCNISGDSSPRDDDDSEGNKGDDTSATVPQYREAAISDREKAQKAPTTRIDKSRKIASAAAVEGSATLKTKPPIASAVSAVPEISSQIRALRQPEIAGECRSGNYGGLQLQPIPFSEELLNSKSTETVRAASAGTKKKAEKAPRESEVSGLQIRSDYAWNKNGSPAEARCSSPASSPSTEASYFLVEPHKLPFDPSSPRERLKLQKYMEGSISPSSSMESFKTTTSSQRFLPKLKSEGSTASGSLQELPKRAEISKIGNTNGMTAAVIGVPMATSGDTKIIAATIGTKAGSDEIEKKTVFSAPKKSVRSDAVPAATVSEYAKSKTPEVSLKLPARGSKEKEEKGDEETDLRSSESASAAGVRCKGKANSSEDSTALRHDHSQRREPSSTSTPTTLSTTSTSEQYRDPKNQNKSKPTIIHAKGDLDYQSESPTVKKVRMLSVQKALKPHRPSQDGKQYQPKYLIQEKGYQTDTDDATTTDLRSSEIEKENEIQRLRKGEGKQQERAVQSKESKVKAALNKDESRDADYQSDRPIPPFQKALQPKKWDKKNGLYQIPQKQDETMHDDDSSTSEGGPSSVPLSDPSSSSSYSYFIEPSYLSEMRGTSDSGASEPCAMCWRKKYSRGEQKMGRTEHLPLLVDQSTLPNENSPGFPKEFCQQHNIPWSKSGFETPKSKGENEKSEDESCRTCDSESEVEFPARLVYLPQTPRRGQRPHYRNLRLEDDETRGTALNSSSSSISDTSAKPTAAQPASSTKRRDENMELWEEISERTFLRDIAHHF